MMLVKIKLISLFHASSYGKSRKDNWNTRRCSEVFYSVKMKTERYIVSVREKGTMICL